LVDSIFTDFYFSSPILCHVSRQQFAKMGKMRILAGLMTVALLFAPGYAHADLASVEALVAKKSAIIEIMHSKARKALVTAAQDYRYREYFAAESADERARLKAEIDRISQRVQAEFHVEEMCLIDPQGAEISRIVKNAIAYDLATNETQNVFFAPGFALRPRTVYVSPLYMSADADKWVLGYVTPIVVDNTTKASCTTSTDWRSSSRRSTRARTPVLRTSLPWTRTAG
jgi:hypothetical protein